MRITSMPAKPRSSSGAESSRVESAVMLAGAALFALTIARAGYWFVWDYCHPPNVWTPDQGWHYEEIK